MSLIPKIALGTKKERSKANLSFDSQTTANIGFVQPTMARLLVPNSSINVKNRTLVRMSPLVNPTFGRLSQRDYFTFVRMSDVYHPWAEFLSGKNYTPSDQVSYIPTQLPRFRMADLVALALAQNSYIGVSPARDIYTTIKENDNFSLVELASFIIDFNTNVQTVVLRNLANISGNAVKINMASSIDSALDPFGASSLVFGSTVGTFLTYDNSDSNVLFRTKKIEPVTYENSDFTIYFDAGSFDTTLSGTYTNENGVSFNLSDGVYLHFRLKPFAKNLRKIFVGLGYGFNYWDEELYTPFKFMAFYKSWFDTFVPLRNYQYTDTYVYRMTKAFEEQVNELTTIQLVRDCIFGGVFNWKNAFYYYTQPDYFSASLYNLGDNSLDVAQSNVISSPVGGDINNITGNADSISNVRSSAGTTGFVNGLSIQMMLKLLRFTNKNNVIGRSIRDYAKTHYGIDDLESDNKNVTKINSHRVDINFDDVMNTAASPDAFLGEYAGKGLGYKESENTFFTTEDFGFFFCMSVIVPETGYFQGSLKENKIFDKFEFFTPEFDALGYDVITRGEIKNDFDTSSDEFDPSSFQTSKGFGFIPRYSHFKVGRNIVNGDLTLKSTRTGLQGYYLDKVFPSIKIQPSQAPYTSALNEALAPDFLPTAVSDNIRRIDPSDNVGDYNRIFQYTDIDMDHFIIQKVFDVEVTAPWKSLSDSFDTVQQDESVINRNHQ